MKKIYLFLAVLLVSVLSFSFVSCSDDDNEPNGNNGDGDGSKQELLLTKILYDGEEEQTFEYNDKNQIVKIEGRSIFEDCNHRV